MIESIKKFLGSFLVQFKNFYLNLTPLKKTSLILSTFLLFSTVVFLGVIFPTTGYEPLFKSVSEDQLPIIINQLKSSKTPYKVTENGTQISVPSDLLRASQMSVMTRLSESNAGAEGLEIFAKQDFGITSYAQKVNYQRALQGELMRAINSLSVVKKSKVILALPPKKTFLEEGGKTTASVVVDLLPGKKLDQEQIRGITFLVANSVENLSAENISIINSKGSMVSKNMSPDSAVSDQIIDLQGKIENRLEAKVQALLERVVGQGGVIARVEASINTKKINTVQELVDPDGIALQSQTTEEENLNGARNSPNGIPGVRSNIPDEARGLANVSNPGYSQNVTKNLKTDNYAVPKTTKQIQESAGGVEKVNVSVLINHKSVIEEKDGVSKKVWQPRSKEELEKYTNIIKGAVGFDAKRGDVVTVENIKFEEVDFSDSDQIFSSMQKRNFIKTTIKFLILAIGLILLFFFAIRPFMSWLVDSFNETVEEILPKTIEELEELQAMEDGIGQIGESLTSNLSKSLDPEKAEIELLKDKIIEIVSEDDEKAVSAVNIWLARRD